MSGHEDAPAIKLYTNKKEQETYENLAGPQMLSYPQCPCSDDYSSAKARACGKSDTVLEVPGIIISLPFFSIHCCSVESKNECSQNKVCLSERAVRRACAPADLFAIVKTTEKLERAYVRDTISAKDYEPLCEKLIAQFRTLWETLRDTVSLSYLLP